MENTFQERAQRAGEKVKKVFQEEQVDMVPKMVPDNWFAKIFKRFIRINFSLGFRDTAPLPKEETAEETKPAEAENIQTS